MSPENVEFVVKRYARYNAGERTPDLDFWHEDAEYQAAREDPDSATHRGIEAIRRQFARWQEAYPDLRVEVQEASESGDHVFVWVSFVGHGAGSGIPIDMELAHVYTLRDGKAPRVVEYFDRDEALEAAGLSDWAMSLENVETIRRGIEAWNRGDLDGFLEGAHPDLEWHPVLAAGVEGSGGMYRGHDGARQFWGEFRAMFDEFSVVIQGARAVGTSVLILGHIHGRAHSGVPVDTPWGAVFEMREGLCVRNQEFLDHGSALEAVGLSG